MSLRAEAGAATGTARLEAGDWRSMKPVIIVDLFERRSGIAEELARLGADVTIAALKHGD
jgi:ERCC4-type nuclease